jgi:hypothetical protein
LAPVYRRRWRKECCLRATAIRLRPLVSSWSYPFGFDRP